MPTKGNILTDMDIKVLKTYAHSTSVKNAAKAMYMSHTSFSYHLQKIHRITGLNPHIFKDMAKLYCEIFGEGNLIYDICHNRH